MRVMIDNYRGPFADGLSSEWIEAMRESLRREVLDAVAVLARTLVGTDPEQTLASLETARGFDPHNDLLYRDIMRLQGRLGRHEAIPARWPCWPRGWPSWGTTRPRGRRTRPPARPPPALHLFALRRGSARHAHRLTGHHPTDETRPRERGGTPRLQRASDEKRAPDNSAGQTPPTIRGSLRKTPAHSAEVAGLGPHCIFGEC